MKQRCLWCKDDPLYVTYHDTEWGTPVQDEKTLFELLILESMQAGLSWITILRKRENFREAFDNFEPEKIARYSAKKVEKLLTNAGIIRHEKKILAAINNAKCFLAIQKEFKSFANYLKQFVTEKNNRNTWKEQKLIPAKTPESDAMAKDLKKRGFAFMGSTTCYAYMQAVGMVNDHVTSCFRYREIKNQKSQ